MKCFVSLTTFLKLMKRTNYPAMTSAPKDSQTEGWALTVLSVPAVIVVVLCSCKAGLHVLSNGDSRCIGIVSYALLAFLGQLLAGVCLVWFCGQVFLSMATYSPSTQRLGKYLLLSACFIALDIAGSLLATGSKSDWTAKYSHFIRVPTSPKGHKCVQNTCQSPGMANWGITCDGILQ